MNSRSHRRRFLMSSGQQAQPLDREVGVEGFGAFGFASSGFGGLMTFLRP